MSPLSVESPETIKLLLIVVVPVEDPNVRLVAPPPIPKVVTPLLKRVAEVWVVVMSPPFKARSPVDVMLPFRAMVN